MSKRIDSFQALIHVELAINKSYSIRMLASEMDMPRKTLYCKIAGDCPLYPDEALTIVRITQLPALQQFVIEQAGLQLVGKSMRVVGDE